MTPRVREILSWYGSETPGVLTNMARILNTGRIAGSGKMVILPVDQGFEHGPARSFAKNPDGYDPLYHYALGVESGCNAYAAPLGALEAGARDFAGEIPMILKLNNSDTIYKGGAPHSSVTASVDDALRLGCVGVGFTIYPGASSRKEQYEELREITHEAKSKGLVVVTWSYPRGEGLSKNGETAIDVVSYGAHIACQLGAHIVKVKAPSDHLEISEAKKIFETHQIKIGSLSDRIKHVVKSCFNGRRVVIFSGGEAKSTDDLLKESREIALGGGFGAIMGRNAFQRPRAEAVKLLQDIMDIYKGTL